MPAQLAAGYTSICFKPSMYTDDAATVPGVTFGVLADKQGHLIGVAAN